MRLYLNLMLVAACGLASPFTFGADGPYDFDMVTALGHQHSRFTFAYTNSRRDGNLLRRFAVTQKDRNSTPTLLDFHFEYLVEGQVLTATLRDVGYVKPTERGLEIYFTRNENGGLKKLPFNEESMKNKDTFATVFPEIQKIKIELTEQPKVTTYFFSDFPRHTILTAIDTRSRFSRLYNESETEIVETFDVDGELTGKILSLGSAKPKQAGLLSGFGWFEEAKRQGLLISLPVAENRNDPITVKLTSESENGFVFTTADERSGNHRFQRFIVSGNKRELGQFLALVNLFSPDDYRELLNYSQLETTASVSLVSESSYPHSDFIFFRDHGNAKAKTIGQFVEEPVTELFPFRKLEVIPSCGSLLTGQSTSHLHNQQHSK